MTTRLEDLKQEALVQGLVGREVVRVFTAEMQTSTDISALGDRVYVTFEL